MTTHVRVMYVLDKHVHALNFLTISIDRSNFPEHVRVWRLILKKTSSTFSCFLLLYQASFLDVEPYHQHSILNQMDVSNYHL